MYFTAGRPILHADFGCTETTLEGLVTTCERFEADPFMPFYD